MINVLSYLEQSARRVPDKCVFADPDRAVSYAAFLRTAKAVGTALSVVFRPNEAIPVFLPKSVDTLEAFFGSVYAGCFYCQLDMRLPAERLLRIISILGPRAIVTARAFEEKIREMNYTGDLLFLEDLRAVPADEDRLAKIRAAAIDTDPLYCNFTSGSTGTPKGVLVSHRSVIDFIDCFTEIFHITENDVIGNQAPFDFDVSVKDIYSTLKTGATMQIIPTRYFSVPAELLDYLCERHVTTLIWAVSAVCLLSRLHGFSYRIPAEVNKVIFSGEVMPVKQLGIWREALPDAVFANVYGPTEITCNCTYYIVDRDFAPGETLPMGKPFPNERVFLLDAEDRLIPDAALPPEPRTGEVCVAGTALALGYLGDAAATACVFTQNPLNPHYPERIYRTGDLAYYDAAGDLVFAGRKDFQIKHMGHRIELGEIEAAMDSLPEIGRAVCLFRNDKICAFYTGDIEKAALSAALKKRLPEYMVPRTFRKLDEIPLNKNGKADRKALEMML
ncbi:MAG: amino acid adenylation domain-containing protein [Lachnospiraceae bacterium]|nr:amino acid adenylation domain-containing protein [Lachnospiraceae bacterium]MBQ6545788.1 amino acid adenylation domain-containing protein [Lachnospiraceae bacterium]